MSDTPIPPIPTPYTHTPTEAGMSQNRLWASPALQPLLSLPSVRPWSATPASPSWTNPTLLVSRARFTGRPRKTGSPPHTQVPTRYGVEDAGFPVSEQDIRAWTSLSAAATNSSPVTRSDQHLALPLIRKQQPPTAWGQLYSSYLCQPCGKPSLHSTYRW